MRPYQYALLRYVHSAVAEEFVNIGVVMYVPNERRLVYRLTEHYARLSHFFGAFDPSGYRRILRAVRSRLAAVERELVPYNQGLYDEQVEPKDLVHVLHQIVSEDSSALRWSGEMAGATDDPDLRFRELFAEFIERNEQSTARERRDEQHIWVGVEAKLRARGVLQRLEHDVQVEGANEYAYRFKTAWTNGVRQVLEPVSLDYLDPSEVVEKANTWTGRLLTLSRGATEFMMTGVVAPPPTAGKLLTAYERAVGMLREAPQIRDVITEDEVSEFIDRIEEDLASH